MSCFDVKIERAKLQFELSSVLVGVLSSSLLALLRRHFDHPQFVFPRFYP